ncbi:MAG: hypothetical protein O2968_18175 [Acidobacteria bacterium]|nr:hypothetical protein [Acidobacteriota bacterium]
MRVTQLIKIAVIAGIGATWFFGDSIPRAATPAAPAGEKWLGQQEWKKVKSGAVIALGEEGAFDDMHVFAPTVVRENSEYRLWYPGSRGTVAGRIFRLGLAMSPDGVRFTKSSNNPVYEFGDGRSSVVTPTMLRQLDGTPIREDGKLRMWFTGVDFSDGLHTLHETTSSDGENWSSPSPPQIENAYAPTVIKDGDGYRMWYTDVGVASWAFRHAASADGRHWKITPEPVMAVDQEWEHRRLFYPTVVKYDGLYLMWYASYWIEKPDADMTAIGFAVSEDGIHWRKNSNNPVLRPDPKLAWESYYNSSQSVMRLDDGTWRIWYGSRKEPPFVNKYFAIATAEWAGP